MRKRFLFPAIAASMGAKVRYLLRDEFTDTRAAGAVNGTPATPGPGTRVVVDTNSKITVGSGLLNFATGAAANDGLWLDLTTRALGRLMVASLTPADTNGIPVAGWDTDQTGAINDNLKLSTTTGIQIVPNGGTAITVGAYTATAYKVAAVQRATGIYWFIKGGAFTTWTLLWITAAGTANVYPGIQAGNATSVFTADNLRVPENLWLPTALAYDTFTRANGALGSTETTGPDGATAPAVALTAKAWTGTTFAISTNKAINTPTVSATELVDDPGLEGTYTGGLNGELEATGGTPTESADVHGGSKAQSWAPGAGTTFLSWGSVTTPVTSNGWYKISWWEKLSAGNASVHMISTGLYTNQQTYGSISTAGYVNKWITACIKNGAAWQYGARDNGVGATILLDDISVKAVTLSSMIASLSLSSANVLASVAITVSATFERASPSGLILRLDSAATPANFLIATLHARNGGWWDGANRAYVNLDKCVAGTYTNLLAVEVTYAAGANLVVVADGSSVTVYYNNAIVGTTQTVSDAGILNNTLHGIFLSDPANSLDNFQVFPRGNGGEYSQLDRYTA